MRSATVRAAIRRGWVWPIWPVTPRPSSRQIFGNWVVLPEPVSPATTTTWWSRMAAAIRDELPGEPLGITVPLSVPAGLLAGWGAAVAAPWPMPASALIAAVRAQRTGASAIAGALCAIIGLGCIAGTLVEPVTRQPG